MATKIKKAIPTLNDHNKRLYAEFSTEHLFALFTNQQRDALDNGIIERKIPAAQLRTFAIACENWVRRQLPEVDTVDKAKKIAAKLRVHFTADAYFFTRALTSSAISFSLTERIAELQAKPTTVQPSGAKLTRRLGNDETVVAKKLMNEHLGVIGRSWNDPTLTSSLFDMGFDAVKNASVKIHNTERETLVARAMMQRLAGVGYERILDGGDYVRVQHKKDGQLAFVFARDGLFVKAFNVALKENY